MSDGIKVSYNEKMHGLVLTCDPQTFASLRKKVRELLAERPEINFDEVLQIHIVDVATIDEKREASKRRWTEAIVMSILMSILVLAIVGAVSIFRWIAT